MDPRLRIGLTGGIASGKSTAAQRFKELEVPVIDADESSRIVVAPGSDGLVEVVAKFGAEILKASGELNRRALRNVIFADAARRRELESILHPLIQADMQKRAAAACGPYVVMAVPLLLEGDGRSRVDRVLIIDLDEELQLERLIERDGETRPGALAILATQVSRAERLRAADDVIVNAGTVTELRHSVDQLHQRYLGFAGIGAGQTGPVR